MLGGEGGRCVDTVMTSGGMIVAATWGGNLVDGSSGRLHHHHHHHNHNHHHDHHHHHHYHHISGRSLVCDAHGGQRITKLAALGGG